MSLSKIELKKQLRALGVKIEGNYVNYSRLKAGACGHLCSCIRGY